MPVLLRQLDLLHTQLIAILTTAVERALIKSSRFDMRNGQAEIAQMSCGHADISRRVIDTHVEASFPELNSII